jgi:hypothetical protein
VEAKQAVSKNREAAQKPAPAEPMDSGNITIQPAVEKETVEPAQSPPGAAVETARAETAQAPERQAVDSIDIVIPKEAADRPVESAQKPLPAEVRQAIKTIRPDTNPELPAAEPFEISGLAAEETPARLPDLDFPLPELDKSTEPPAPDANTMDAEFPAYPEELFEDMLVELDEARTVSLGEELEATVEPEERPAELEPSALPSLELKQLKPELDFEITEQDMVLPESFSAETFQAEFTELLDNPEPEQIAAGQEIVNSIIESVRVLADETAVSADALQDVEPELIIELQVQCAQLFEQAGIEYDEETLDSFVQGIVRAQLSIAEARSDEEPETEAGTHEQKVINYLILRNLSSLKKYKQPRHIMLGRYALGLEVPLRRRISIGSSDYAATL